VKYILNQKALAFTMLFLALINFIVAPLAYNVLPFLTYHIMQISEYQLSFIQGAFAVGGILGAMWVGLAKSNAQMVRKFFKAVAMQGVLVCLWIFPDIGIISLEQKKLITLLFAGITFFMGIFHSLQSIPFVAYYQVKVEERYRARVFGALRTAIMILTPIGIMIYGVLEQVWPSCY
jgi:energy-converting hydrogenase Eha subunit G